MQTTITDHLTVLAERVEAEFMDAYVSGAPASARFRLAIRTARIGGGVVLSMRDDPTGYWSKALGFGITEPVTADLVDEILGFYRAHDDPEAVLQIAPAALPPDWAEICAARGIEEGHPLVKLAAPVEVVGPATTGLSIGEVGPADAPAWASVVLRGFGMPLDGLIDMVTAAAGHGGFRPYAAWDGDALVAAANVFVMGEVASLNTTATLPVHRRRGAQQALIAAGAEAARRAGCRWLVAEVAQPAEGTVNPSLTNMLRAGLRELYVRPNWVWRDRG
ncbi:GNAT family N-acetyltransferase [Nucisporomicrobium flavum]|uniref:GNAT family N-acetyltransferase n=1 Tax=Nucisporomicrobium flavum TaxID=2785915 RepID=UPI003C2EAABC